MEPRDDILTGTEEVEEGSLLETVLKFLALLAGGAAIARALRGRRARYRMSDGVYLVYMRGRWQEIPRKRIRRALDLVLHRGMMEVQTRAFQVQRGELQVVEFVVLLRQDLRSAHLASGALASGGWRNMTTEDFRRIQERIAGEETYLERFRQQLLSGQQPIDGRFVERGRQYIEAARRTYHNIEVAQRRRMGFTEYRNVLDPGAMHCSECVEVTRRGWVPIGSLPEIGDRECRVRDRCHFEFR